MHKVSTAGCYNQSLKECSASVASNNNHEMDCDMGVNEAVVHDILRPANDILPFVCCDGPVTLAERSPRNVIYGVEDVLR